MLLEVEANPNCAESQQFVFQVLGECCPVLALRVGEGALEEFCDVIGVEEGGRWTAAQAVKITDSSDGFAFLIRGGAWGIRLRPQKYSSEPWDLNNRRQWGEPFKIYGASEDLVYGNR